MKEYIKVTDILDYCNHNADICRKLHEDALNRYSENGSAHNISAMAYFMQQEAMMRYEIPRIIKQLAEEHKERTFGEKINRLLKENSISQKKLAEKVGITEVSMSRYISGDRVPKGPVVMKIAKELGTTVEYLLEEL